MFRNTALLPQKLELHQTRKAKYSTPTLELSHCNNPKGAFKKYVRRGGGKGSVKSDLKRTGGGAGQKLEISSERTF